MRTIIALLATTSILLTACGNDAAPPPKQPDAVKTTRRDSQPRAVTSGASHSTGMTYDDALAEPEDVMALKSERELTNQELSLPMKDSSFIGNCNAPDSMKVTVKVAVRDGKALGVSVLTDPDDPTVAECIDSAVRNFTWPVSKRRDSFITAF